MQAGSGVIASDRPARRFDEPCRIEYELPRAPTTHFRATQTGDGNNNINSSEPGIATTGNLGRCVVEAALARAGTGN